MLANVVCSLPYFALAGQKDQDVTLLRWLPPQLIHCIGNGRVQVIVAALFVRTVPLLDRKSAPRHHDDGCGNRLLTSACKVFCKAICINRGRGHHHLQVGPAGQNLSQVAKQEIDVQAALMGFVNDDGVVSFEQRVGLGLGQQNAICHQFDRGVSTQPVLKTHLVADHLTERRMQFLRNPFGDATGRNAARLGVPN